MEIVEEQDPVVEMTELEEPSADVVAEEQPTAAGDVTLVQEQENRKLRSSFREKYS